MNMQYQFASISLTTKFKVFVELIWFVKLIFENCFIKRDNFYTSQSKNDNKLHIIISLYKHEYKL